MDIEDLQQHAYIVGQSVLATALLEGMKVEKQFFDKFITLKEWEETNGCKSR